MPKKVLGIIGGGQLGSMLASAARKVNIKTIIICDDPNAPAKKFADEFILSNYNNDQKIEEFAKKVDIVTFEFENIPYLTLEKINKFTKVLPEPNINKIIQNRLTEKDFLNKINIKTTLYASIENEEELKLNKIYTHAYDLRPHLYPVLERQNFKKEKIFTDINNNRVIIHSKYKNG